MTCLCPNTLRFDWRRQLLTIKLLATDDCPSARVSLDNEIHVDAFVWPIRSRGGRCWAVSTQSVIIQSSRVECDSERLASNALHLASLMELSIDWFILQYTLFYTSLLSSGVRFWIVYIFNILGTIRKWQQIADSKSVNYSGMQFFRKIFNRVIPVMKIICSSTFWTASGR